METILLRYYSIGIFFQSIMGVIGVVTLIVILIWQLREIYLAEREKTKQKRNGQRSEKADSGEPPVLLTPKERREYMLNHIEDGRFYAISSLRNSETCILCAKRYDAEEEQLYCYAYLWISGKGDYNLHIEDPRDTSQSCKFLGNQSLRIDFDINPRCVVFEEENISPYIVDRDYNTFVHSLQAAGFDWKIEKDGENMLGFYKYMLKETKTK